MNKTILIVEGDMAARKMLARVLGSCGYVPVEASSAGEAITQFCAASPALAIMDLNAEPESWTVYEAFRKLDPSVPVIGITAWSNQYVIATRRGIDALMEKPLDIKALLEMIEQLTTVAAGRKAADCRSDFKHTRQGVEV